MTLLTTKEASCFRPVGVKNLILASTKMFWFIGISINQAVVHTSTVFVDQQDAGNHCDSVTLGGKKNS